MLTMYLGHIYIILIEIVFLDMGPFQNEMFLTSEQFVLFSVRQIGALHPRRIQVFLDELS